MPITLKVYIAEAGAPTADGKTSLAGHMWLSVTKDGATASRGFNSGPTARPFGAGTVSTSDNLTYGTTGNVWSSQSVTLTDRQYADFLALDTSNMGSALGMSSNYNVLTNSCIDFVYAALGKLGLNSMAYQGLLVPSANKNEIPTMFAFSALMEVDPAFGTLFTANKWVTTEENGIVIIERVTDENGKDWWNTKPNVSISPNASLLRRFMTQSASDRAQDFLDYCLKTSKYYTQIQGEAPPKSSENLTSVPANSIVDPGMAVAQEFDAWSTSQAWMDSPLHSDFSSIRGLTSSMAPSIDNLVSAMAQFSGESSSAGLTDSNFGVSQRDYVNFAVSA